MLLLKGSAAKELIEQEVREHLNLIHDRDEKVTIALFRVGEKPDDCRYESTILKACSRLGIDTESFVFPEDVDENELYQKLNAASENTLIDGILLFRPLPMHLRTEKIRTAIPAEKDIDGTLLEDSDFLPCTPEGVMYLLKAYQIDVKDKKCVVVGRSAVVGKPLAELLRNAGAKVEVCHTQTPDVPAVTKTAEILFAACGRPQMIDRNYLSKGQIIIDIGFHAVDGVLCGDVNAEDAKEVADAYTPVPGGTGAVTLSVLLLHAVRAHERNRL